MFPPSVLEFYSAPRLILLSGYSSNASSCKSLPESIPIYLYPYQVHTLISGHIYSLLKLTSFGLKSLNKLSIHVQHAFIMAAYKLIKSKFFKQENNYGHLPSLKVPVIFLLKWKFHCQQWTLNRIIQAVLNIFL